MKKIRHYLGILGLAMMLGVPAYIACTSLPVQQLRVETKTKVIPGPLNHIKIGPYDYKVEWVNGFMDDCVAGDVDQGCTDTVKLKIRVSGIGDIRVRQAALLHEVLHAVLDANVTPRNGEDVAETSPMLLEVLQDNPELVKFLTEK